MREVPLLHAPTPMGAGRHLDRHRCLAGLPNLFLNLRILEYLVIYDSG